MYKKETDKIKISINSCALKLQTILPHLGENKPILNETYNKILIEKAVLREKLKQKETPFFVKLAKRLNSTSRKGLICDYFKYS